MILKHADTCLLAQQGVLQGAVIIVSLLFFFFIIIVLFFFACWRSKESCKVRA
jgi:hypothetical protein